MSQLKRHFDGKGGVPLNFARFLTLVLCVAAGWIASTHVTVASERQPVVHQVKIEKFRFVPADLTIRQGDSVEWINLDIAPHTATEDNKVWDTGRLNKDQITSVTFSTPGAQSYFCRYHPSMRGQIIVQAQ